MRGSESYHLTKEQTFAVGNCHSEFEADKSQSGTVRIHIRGPLGLENVGDAPVGPRLNEEESFVGDGSKENRVAV